jgi:FlaA1/EpsC-like NDP-sugar epimerase
MKHVRSEKDPFSLMRLIKTNVFNTVKILETVRPSKFTNYFCVSTDKAANPVNLMGASKRIMEFFLMRESIQQSVSMARFANVAFSDGSLLFGFRQRFIKHQPIAAPDDVKRYFVTEQEAGQLCLLSGLLGQNREIFFPKLDPELDLLTFSEIARRYLRKMGFDPYECDSEEEARGRCFELIRSKKWPCYFSKTFTTGEKDIEEFFTIHEDLDLNRFESVGIIKNQVEFDLSALDQFQLGVNRLLDRGAWKKEEILDLFNIVLPNFDHKETGRNLDERM